MTYYIMKNKKYKVKIGKFLFFISAYNNEKNIDDSTRE